MTGAIGLLAFVSIFQIIGGIALGWVLRRILARQFNATVFFMLIWGTIFSLVPLGMGVSSFAAMNEYPLISVQILTFVGVIAITAFTPQEYLSAFTSPPVVSIAFGGVILLIGSAVLAGQFRQDPVTAVIVGAVFSLVGIVFLAIGARTALKTK